MIAPKVQIAALMVGLILCVIASALLPMPWRMLPIILLAAAALALGISRRQPGVRAKHEISAVEETQEPKAAAEQPAFPLPNVLDVLPVGVIVVGADGRITLFNKAAGEIFGVAYGKAVGRSLIEMVRSFEMDRRINATLRDGVEETTEFVYTAAQERRLQVSTRLLQDAQGRSQVLAIVVDFTRIRELESLRREFVSNVSHELRTPLTAVKLMVETLQTDGVDARAREDFLQSIGTETDRMITLVEDLLDLARLESGKLELRLGSVDVAALCREAGANQARRAQSMGIKLDISAPELPMMISADRDKLYQVVVNLLDNALRHTPPEGRVTLSANKDNGHVSIVVQDTGAGIPSTALPHIFERFYVVDPARARSRSGTGLGLAIVKHIVEAHGGTITADSELGIGTKFACTLRG